MSRALLALLEMPLGWLQLKHQKPRLLVALAGIAFAVILILMPLGFRASLFESAVRYHQRLQYDVALFSTESSFIALAKSFSSRRLYQALGVDGVEAVSPVYMYRSFWKNPYDHQMRNVLTLGIDPSDDVLDAPGVRENLRHVRRRDVVLFDGASRAEHGPIAERFAAGEQIETEVNDRLVQVGGIFTMGPSFGIDGSILTSVDNFLRLFPNRSRTQIDLGLITIGPGRDPETMRDQTIPRMPCPTASWTNAFAVCTDGRTILLERSTPGFLNSWRVQPTSLRHPNFVGVGWTATVTSSLPGTGFSSFVTSNVVDRAPPVTCETSSRLLRMASFTSALTLAETRTLTEVPRGKLVHTPG